MSSTAQQPSPAEESFGRRLRRERERRHIALASIAENTKISLAFLEELERDDVARWPAGIFRRAFIRAYAQAIGLDVEATAREFLERFPEQKNCTGFPALTLPSPPTSTLRLTLADTGELFTRGRLLEALGRLAAIACDLSIVATIGLGTYVAWGKFWMPFSIALVAYYAGGILLLGTTPGVRLCAPRHRQHVPRLPRISSRRHVRSRAEPLRPGRLLHLTADFGRTARD